MNCLSSCFTVGNTRRHAVTSVSHPTHTHARLFMLTFAFLFASLWHNCCCCQGILPSRAELASTRTWRLLDPRRSLPSAAPPSISPHSSLRHHHRTSPTIPERNTSPNQRQERVPTRARRLAKTQQPEQARKSHLISADLAPARASSPAPPRIVRPCVAGPVDDLTKF